jgi:hypothetical protein
MMVSGYLQKAFNYQSSDSGMTMLMPESHAAEHHEYLSRYIETGEGKVIGRQGRNLVGKGKGDRLFPISLKIEKMEIQKEIFFATSLWDTSNCCYINGFGLITNADEQFWYISLFFNTLVLCMAASARML